MQLYYVQKRLASVSGKILESLQKWGAAVFDAEARRRRGSQNISVVAGVNAVKLVTFGETLVQRNADYIGPYDPDGGYTPHVAGAESNVALDLVRLMPGEVRAVWVSRLGADEILPHLDGADLLHVTGITPALSDACRETTLEAMAAAQRMGVPVSMDVNYREALWSPSEARAMCDRMREYATLFKVGYDEAETIWGDGLSAREHALRFISDDKGGATRIAAVTTGDSGAVAACDGELVEHPGFSVEVVDPVGAGDAFVAGMLAGIFTSGERGSLAEFLAMEPDDRSVALRDALALGNACGALVCTQHGDTEPMPDMARARAFIWEGEIGHEK